MSKKCGKKPTTKKTQKAENIYFMRETKKEDKKKMTNMPQKASSLDTSFLFPHLSANRRNELYDVNDTTPRKSRDELEGFSRSCRSCRRRRRKNTHHDDETTIVNENDDDDFATTTASGKEGAPNVFMPRVAFERTSSKAKGVRQPSRALECGYEHRYRVDIQNETDIGDALNEWMKTGERKMPFVASKIAPAKCILNC